MPKKAGCASEWRAALFKHRDDLNQCSIVFMRFTEVYPLIGECFVCSLNRCANVDFIQNNGPSSPSTTIFFLLPFRVSLRCVYTYSIRHTNTHELCLQM